MRGYDVLMNSMPAALRARAKDIQKMRGLRKQKAIWG